MHLMLLISISKEIIITFKKKIYIQHHLSDKLITFIIGRWKSPWWFFHNQSILNHFILELPYLTRMKRKCDKDMI